MALFAELKRRNVFRVGIAYVVLSWLLLQITDVVVPILELPDWVARLLLFLLLLGFPLALIFAWVFELTPDGLMREKDVVRAESITAHTGRKLDYTTIALLVLALAWFAWGTFFENRPSSQPASVSSQAGEAETNMGEPGIPIIAVLPFKAAGSDDGGFLAGGLHDDLLTRLAKLGGFRVISRTSMMEYADATISMPEIGRELGARYILEGGVQARDERVRINAQLIDAPTDSHLWAEVYDRKLTAVDLFDVQAELAVAIATAIKAKLSPEELAAVEAVPTTNMAAYAAYLRGVQVSQSRAMISALDRRELEAFEEAVALDPDFALAWAHLSMARSRHAFVTRDEETPKAALAALARARALQPALLEAELAWADYLYRVMYEYQQAVDALTALGSRAAGNVEVLMLKAWLYRRLGRYEEAYETLLQVSALDPRTPATFLHLMMTAILLDDCGSARVHAGKALALAPDKHDVKMYAAVYELECNGDAQRAHEILSGQKPAGSLQTQWHIALQLRDAERLLALAEVDFGTPLVPAWHSLGRAVVYREIAPDADQLARALDSSRSELQALEQDTDLAAGAEMASLHAILHSLAGDADDTRYWVGEHKRRSRVEVKEDLFRGSQEHLNYALAYARAGLIEEAIEELRVMLEQPGGHRFPYFDGLAAFDVLRDHPAYVDLRERFGN